MEQCRNKINKFLSPLEDKVVNVLDKMNVKVTKNNREVCDRFGNSKAIILRLVNRKHWNQVLKKRCLCLFILPVLGLYTCLF